MRSDGALPGNFLGVGLGLGVDLGMGLSCQIASRVSRLTGPTRSDGRPLLVA